MDAISKIAGEGRQILHTGVGEWTAPTGYQAYGVKIRVNATRIDTLDEITTGGGTAAAKTDYTWEGVDTLLAGETINFEYPVTAITLHGAADSIWIYCETT